MMDGEMLLGYGLPWRTFHALRNRASRRIDADPRFLDPAELAKMDDDDILSVRNIGPAGLRAIRKAFGPRLAMRPEDV